jgi:hypothetical protein
MIIEDAYNNFHSIVHTALDAYGSTLTPVVNFKELDDNVIIENNDNKKLKNGFAIQFVGDTNGAIELSGHTYINQTVYVTLTTANFGTIRDISERKDAEKMLLAMKDSVVKAIGFNPQLDDTVAKCVYEGTDPIEFILDEQEKNYLMVRSTYTIGYYESSP